MSDVYGFVIQELLLAFGPSGMPGWSLKTESEPCWVTFGSTGGTTEDVIVQNLDWGRLIARTGFSLPGLISDPRAGITPERRAVWVPPCPQIRHLKPGLKCQASVLPNSPSLNLLGGEFAPHSGAQWLYLIAPRSHALGGLGGV